MIVKFKKPILIKQHGLLCECIFTECLSINFKRNKAYLKFGKNDSCTIAIGLIKEII